MISISQSPCPECGDVINDHKCKIILVETRVTGNPDVVQDYKNHIIGRSDIIMHHTSVCQSKYFQMIRFLSFYGKHLSVGEITNKILMNQINE